MPLIGNGKILPCSAIKLLRIMKLTCFFLLAVSMHVHAVGYAQITVHEKNAPFEKVLREIGAQSGMKLIYQDRLLVQEKTVSIELENVSLRDALDALVAGRPLRWELIARKIIAIKAKDDSGSAGGTRDGTVGASGMGEMAFRPVTGTVTGPDGLPLANVSVTIEGSAHGTTTDDKGFFQLNVQPGQTLIFSSIGYTVEKVRVGSLDVINVKLSKNTNAMNEVVVTALGIGRQRRALGYSEDQIKGAELQESNAPNVINAITGKMASVNVTNSNGVDGGSTHIVIDGNNIISNKLTIGGKTVIPDNQPLIVIDGMPMDNSIAPAAQDVTQPKDWGSAINLINPQDIESFSVLKGPAAAALYGGRGANGVILITLKKGSKRSGLGVDYNFAYKDVHPYRYIDMQNEYGSGGMVSLDPVAFMKDNTGTPILTDGWNGLFVDPVSGSGPYGVATWNQVSWPGSGLSWGPKMDGTMIKWWDGTMQPDNPQPDNIRSYYREGNQSSHNISVQGGNETATLRASFTRTDNTAIVPNSDFNQNSFNLGTSVRLTKRVNVQVNASYFSNVYHNAPYLGNTENDIQSNLIYAYGRDYKGKADNGDYRNFDGSQNQFVNFPWNGNGQAKWIYWNTYAHNEVQTRRKLLGSAQLNYDATSFLSFLLRASIDVNNNEDRIVNDPTDPDGITGATYGHGLIRDNANNIDWLGTLHKDGLFGGDINGKLSVGGTAYSRSMYSITGSNTSTFAVPYMYYFGNYSGTIQTGQLPTEDWNERKVNSLYGFLNLSYKSFLYLDITGRNDWSSTLPPDQWSYFFPSFSGSFVFSDLLHIDKSVLSFGKLRAAWAEGAADVPFGAIYTVYNTGSFAGAPTASLPASLQAKNYKPQVNKTADFGVSLGFLNDRLNLDFRYYHGRSYNQLLNSPLPVSSGVSSITVNTGVLENSGVEMTLHGKPFSSKTFTWDIGLNLSKNWNKLLSLTEGADRVDMDNIWGGSGVYVSAVVGKEYGAIMGYDYVYDPKTHKKVLQDAGMIMQNFGVDAATAAKMQGTMYESSQTMVPIGNSTPKFYGGITNTFTFKDGFSLSALIDCKVGGQIWSGTYASTMQQGTAPQTLKERNGGGLPYTSPDGSISNSGVILPGVYPDGTPNTNVVHYYYKYMQYGVWSSGPNGSNWIHKTSIFNDTWYKLREVDLNYTLPATLVKKAKAFQSATISLVGRDLFYLYSSLPNHINPEGINGAGAAQGIEFASLPGVRSLGFQVRLTF